MPVNANRAERRRRMKTSELREQAIEALNQTPYIDIETDNGDVFRVWHPLLVDDDAQTRIEAFNNQDDLDRDESGNVIYPAKVNGRSAEPAAIRSARAILGPQVHKAFVKAGGHSNDVQLAWNEMVRQHEEADTVLAPLEVVEADDPKSATP